MAVAVLLIVAAALGTYGYFRGATRLLLTLLPLILASCFLWLLGPAFYRIDVLRSAGLVWPAFVLVVVGVAGGYALQFLAKRKLPKKIRRADHFAGSVIGVLLSSLLVWLGCVYVAVWSASRRGEGPDGSTANLARILDSTVLRWIPVVGSGSAAMMGLLEISTADDEVRQQALQTLGLDRLFDVPHVRAVLEDTETQKDVEAAARGSISALWRLQKSPKILELLETDEIREALASHSLSEIVEAIRESKQSTAAHP